ncbi:MAG: sulfatase [Verrucomicrobia bacterium]|nr:sulfatase [Verrucomicrobiota bacterium]
MSTRPASFCLPKARSLGYNHGMKMVSDALALFLLLFTFQTPTSADARTSSPKLNVLFIASDDMRPELACYGNKLVQSPNIDRLAARGVRFDRAYCQYPLCNPSRTSMLTGRYPTTSGVMDNNKYFRDGHPNWVTLPQYFRNHGYVTARTGKIYHGGIDDEPSWIEGAEKGGTRAARTPQQQQAQRQNSDRWAAVENEEKQGDYRSATRAIELLEHHKGKPFFIAVGFSKPHSPPVAPKKYFEPYDVTKMPLPVDFAPRPAAPPGFPEASVPKRNGDLFIDRDASETEAREVIRAYYACISFVDAQVGRVLDALDRLGLRERTVVVFFGDHGYHLGEKGKWSKHNSLFEVATRVPFIVSPPSSAGNGRTCGRTVEFIDLYPTLAELCGLPKPAGVEGDSLVPLLKDPQAAWDHPAFTVTKFGPTFGQSVRTERWRYTEWSEGKAGAVLFDEQADPHELKNLAKEENHAATVAEMKELLRKQSTVRK